MDVHGKGIVTGNAPVRTYREKKISIWEAQKRVVRKILLETLGKMNRYIMVFGRSRKPQEFQNTDVLFHPGILKGNE